MIKYIFSINTGRSGSHYLCNLFNSCKNITAFHEPDPVLNGKVMFQFLKGETSLMEKNMKNKVSQIEKDLEQNSIYVETNHTFIKGFGWLIPNYLPNDEIGIIILKRDKNEIINSFQRIGASPFNAVGLNWIITPFAKKSKTSLNIFYRLLYKLLFFFNKFFRSKYSFIKIKIDQLKYFKKIERIYLQWYIDETYLLAEEFKHKFPKIKVYEIELKNLNNINAFKEIFDFFNIEFKPDEELYKKIGTRTNLK